MELFNVLNELEDLVENSPKIPLTRRVLIDEEKLLDYLDRMRAALPEEVRQAKWVLQEREKVLADSKKEALRIMEEAQKQLDRRAEESEIARQAKAIAEEVVQKAEVVAREIKQGARDYADDILSGLEKELNKLITQVRNGRAELKGYKPAEEK
ncbi:MAG: ATPase [Armatimonadetes bacterium]|nr:ATPase [Armatimonadota bacterium]